MAEHAHTTMQRRPEDAPSGTGRRSLFAAAPALALALAAPAFASDRSDDAELLQLCGEYIALDTEFVAYGEHIGDRLFDDPEYVRCGSLQAAMVPRLHELEAAIADLPATTPAGLRAKARAAMHALSGDAAGGDGPMDSDDNGLSWSLLQDVVGGSIGA